MLGGLGNIANILKQAGQMKDNLARLQEELAARRFEGEAGAGLVRAVVNGRSELIDIKIDPRAAEDLELLEELIKGAVCAASRRAQDSVKEEMSRLTGGMNLPGLEDVLGGGSG